MILSEVGHSAPPLFHIAVSYVHGQSPANLLFWPKNSLTFYLYLFLPHTLLRCFISCINLIPVQFARTLWILCESCSSVCVCVCVYVSQVHKAIVKCLVSSQNSERIYPCSLQPTDTINHNGSL